MQRFAIIGLGRFGARLAANLAAAGHDVVGIDRDVALVEEMRDRVTLAVALDGADEQALLMQGVNHVDVAVVGIGGDFESIVLATVVLKRIGVPKVVARAISPVSAQVLASVGADEVVNPEDESADRWADRLMSPHFLKHVELDPRHSIVEIKPPARWIGQTLKQLDLRAQAGLHIIAIKRKLENEDEPDAVKIKLPHPDDPIMQDDILVVLGDDDNLAQLPVS